jgi:predicted membrane protein
MHHSNHRRQRRGPGGGGGLVPNTREGYDRQRYLDRCFEFLKHVTTLSTAAALLILAIYREQPFKERLLALTLVLMGLCVVLSAYGMLIIATGSRKPSPNQITFSEETLDAMIWWITTTTGGVFSASVIAFALAILSIPFWYALLLLGAIAVLLTVSLLFVRRRRKRQVSDAISVEDDVEVTLESRRRSWWRRLIGG